MEKIIGKERDRIIQEEYIVNNKSREDVAKMLGVSFFSFIYYIGVKGIKKTLGENTYKNKNWLYNEYIVKHISPTQIAKNLNCSRYVIYNWLHSYNIDRRCSEETSSYKNSCNLSSYIKEFIIGEVLGDGSLLGKGKYTAYYQHGNKHREYIVWLEDTFLKFGIEKIGKIRGNLHQCGNGSASMVYSITTKTYRELKELRTWFYPKGKKIIPYNLELTPLIVRQWYLGDGSLKKYNARPTAITLATQGFLKKDVENIIKKLLELGVEAKKSKIKNKEQYGIYINRKSINKFFNYIGKCPKEIESIYGYKWPKQI